MVHRWSRKLKMLQTKKFYIDGNWVDPIVPSELEVINPADETVFSVVSLGSADDVDRAVAAARVAFPTWSGTSHEERLTKLEILAEIYAARSDEIAKAISTEMGAPKSLAVNAQAAAGLGHI